MKKNKLDKSIKEKFSNRTLEPSVSAWERLSVKLEEQPKQNKKGWFSYRGYAATILVLMSIGIYTLSDDEQVSSPKQIIVEENRDTTSIKNKIEQHFNAISIDKALVKSEKVEKKKEGKSIEVKNVTTNSIAFKEKRAPFKKEESLVNKNKEKIRNVKIKENNPIIIPIKEEFSNEVFTKQNLNSRIKVNAADLLYAVTHGVNGLEKKEAKPNMSRKEILKTIKTELNKSNLKVNPETILSEVEHIITSDIFQNNFLKSLKKRISNIATSIASRND
jgi:hypothetical protein